MGERKRELKKTRTTSRRGSKNDGSIHRWKLALAVGACIFLAAYFFHDGGSKNPFSVLLTTDSQSLRSALWKAKDETNTTTLTDLSHYMMRVGLTLESNLANAADNSHTIAMQADVSHAAKTYQLATQFLLESLTLLLNGESESHALQNNKVMNYHVESTYMWRWIAVATYALSTALPEYFLAMDDTKAHADVLMTGLHLLLNVSNAAAAAAATTDATSQNYNSSSLFMPSVNASLVDCTLYETSSRWKKFCESGFTTLDSLGVRRAAILEELIALYPDYAPLRLHYVVAFSLHHDSTQKGGKKKDIVLAFIQREKTNLHTRIHVDPLHEAILHLCEAFTLFNDDGATYARGMRDKVNESLRKIGTCAKLIRPFHVHMNSWRQRFTAEERPDAMDQREAGRLMHAMKEVLAGGGGGGEELFPAGMRECGVPN